jgi:hypothetical protein
VVTTMAMAMALSGEGMWLDPYIDYPSDGDGNYM